MQTGLPRFHREQSSGEELANSISHGIGLVAALIGTPFLILQSAKAGSLFRVSASIFCATLIFLYLASTLYHSLPQGQTKHVLRRIEHAAIPLLIAGTYTPFALGVLHGPWGWTLFGLIWCLAGIGLALKIACKNAHPILFTCLYLLMGWIVLIAIEPLLNRIPAAGFHWLLAGGLAYTTGIIFFATGSRLRYGHLIWHLFVMAGTVCHYFAILWYAA